MSALDDLKIYIFFFSFWGKRKRGIESFKQPTEKKKQ
jgi:hypothetical protein